MARKSVGVHVSATVLEFRHTIKLIQILNEEIAEIEERIQNHMQEINSPLESIHGISTHLAAIIEAETATFKGFHHQIKFWHSPDYRRRLINLESALQKMPPWN